MIKWSRFLLFAVVVAVLATLIVTTTDPVAKNIKLGLDLKGGFEILYEVQPLHNEKVTPDLMLAVKSMVEQRVNIGGVTEPDITIEGSNRLRVKLAGATNQDELRQLIGKPAQLTFRDDKGKILMTGNDLAAGGAGVGADNAGRPAVTLKFKEKEKFANITREYLGKTIAIYLDDKMLTNPRINTAITAGQAIIEGNYTIEQAKQEAELINSGALPANLIEKQVQAVGASLGTMAMQKTLFAGYIGGAVIFLFMILVYRMPGMIANIALAAFTYFCMVVLEWMNATLTLPGIAGFILSVGMAVDANIITYERIQEEIRSGKTILSAFRAGQRRSFITIIDAHVTTLIACAVLFFFGTSSIVGFAVILAMTIVVSILTNVFGSRFLLWLIIKANMFKKPAWYGVKESEIGEL